MDTRHNNLVDELFLHFRSGIQIVRGHLVIQELGFLFSIYMRNVNPQTDFYYWNSRQICALIPKLNHILCTSININRIINF